jgi:glycerophosphoryl diester phosphodiesterase
MNTSPSLSPAFDLQGHRGARGLFPENTRQGFAAALALGVRSLELDVAVTADDVVVVTHDPELNPDIVRTPEGVWLPARGPSVRSLTAAELARLDVGRLRPGSQLAALYPEQAPRDGARMPLLAEVLALAAPAGVVVDLELKTQPDRPALTVSPEAMAEAVMTVLREAAATGMAPRVAVRSFDWRGLRHLRARHPAIPLVYLTSPETVRDAALWWNGVTPAAFGGSVPDAVAAEAAASAWRPVWAPQHAALQPEEIARAHALGLLVVPWTVNAPADMARLIGLGVDGLCTDRPDLARQVMREAGMALPPGYGAPS